ncbi:MAG: hypothetical protein K6U03_10550, partial [Firmicutes bacterium]|nr:hypothetical protein [Bacillota bacterium]
AGGRVSGADGDPFRLELLLTSREDFGGRIELALVKPDGSVLTLENREIALGAGEHRLSFMGVLRTELTGIHAFRVKVLEGEVVLARQDFPFLCGEVELSAVETDHVEYLYGDETIRGLIHLYGEGSGEVELSLDGKAVAVIPVTLSGAAAVPFALDGLTPVPGEHTLTALFRGPEGNAAGGAATFVYGAGLPDLFIAAVEVGKQPTAEGAFPVSVTVEKANLLPARGVMVRVYHEETLLGEYTIELLAEEGARHRGTILWAPGEFSGRAVITAEVSLMEGAKEFDTKNNAATVEVEIPQKPVLDGLPAVTKEGSFPISGRTSPGALVLLYREGEVIDFASADGDGFFTLSDFRLPEGVSHLSLKARGEGGRESLESETFTVFVDSVPPAIWPLNITQGYAYNYDLVPEVVVEEENLAEVLYTLDGQVWTPGTPVTTEGEHFFHVRAVDRAGNEAELSLSFVIDKTPPVITVANLIDGAYYASPIEPEIVIEEEHPDSVEILLNDEVYLGGEIIADGSYELAIFALDKAGNGDYYRVGFTVDRTPPRIEV